MANLSQLTLIGRATNPGELRYTPAGKAVCKFDIAVNHGYGDNKSTSYFNCSCWGPVAEWAGGESGVTKGGLYFVQGELKQREYNNSSGQKVKAYELNALKIERLATPQGRQEQSRPSQSSKQQRPNQSEWVSESAFSGGLDDIPF